jgi:penicillin amidase
LYTSYEPIPCRSNLPRNPDGSFPDGANPTQVLDGTKYGGWSIPLKGDIVDESSTDAATCVVPFDKIPMSINPDQGFVATANNDPGGFSFDGNVFNDAAYIGGPWEEGYRVSTISRSLSKEIAENRASIAGMAEVQGNIDSRVGELFTPYLLQAIAHAKSGGPTAADQRLTAIYADDAAAFDEVSSRLTRWGMHGYQARSGVKTFYKTPTDIEIDDAPSTMIFNAWMRVFFRRVLNDEPIQDILGNMGQEKEVRVLYQLVVARGDAGRNALGSWEPTRKESVYFDDLTTSDVIETCDEEMMLALEDALAGLRSPSTMPDVGGFGTADMSKWIWGLRHQVTFLSLIAKYLPSDQAKMFSFITDQLQISTAVLPLASPGETIEPDDPRTGLTWFPRDGDQWSVNAANMGFGGSPTTGFMYGSGPVMRMVFEVSPQGAVGQDVMPGGQSGLTDSPNYSDQARLWLANTAYPMRVSPSEVAANALRHEVFLPSGE